MKTGCCKLQRQLGSALDRFSFMGWTVWFFVNKSHTEVIYSYEDLIVYLIDTLKKQTLYSVRISVIKL